MSIKSGWLIVLLKSSVSILIFCLIVLAVIEKGILKWPTMIAGLSISFFISVIPSEIVFLLSEEHPLVCFEVHGC